ncbi:plasmalemma vesicle-associated protein [Eublepharis macularius]|uniref:Plasmalemma vesicle-associated protein n=1 Tax=Eublepharis macularius TaxID=481883 RepID=A0AA97JEV3_EUBMA|nr:plasmalemma vesicle-associated protein [Eublepharis macularius]
MEKNPYSLAKVGLENNSILRPQRDCGFYAKYVFLFLSLIQFLIILGLVLFMVYANNHAAAETHLKGMTIWVEECRVKTGLLSKEKDNLTHLLNASRAESRQIQGQLNRLNFTSKLCTAEKLKLQGQLRQTETVYQNFRECSMLVNIFNATYPDKVNALQAQLKAEALKADLEQKKLAQENERLKEEIKKVEQKETACRREVLQVRTQVQKVGELEAKVMGEMQAVRQNLKSALETALPGQPIWMCNTEEVRTLQTTCLNLSKQLDGYMAGLGQRLEDRINAVGKENALLQKEKSACSQDLLERDHKLTAQEQRSGQEKQALQAACNTQTSKMYAEQHKLISEKETLRLELERTKQKCWSVPPPNPAIRPLGVPGASGGTNPIASSPGNFNPNTFNANWMRTVQLAPSNAFSDPGNLGVQRNSAPLGNTGSHRTNLGHTGFTRLEEGKKAVVANGTSPHQPLLRTVGHSSG